MTSESGHEISPLWWPDGKRLAFINVNIDNEISHQLSSVRLADGKLESLTSITPGSLPYNNPRWSSDRNHIYIKRSVENRLNLWSLSVEDGSMRQLTDLQGKSGRLQGNALATDVEYLYFTWEEDFGDIWVMDVAQED